MIYVVKCKGGMYSDRERRDMQMREHLGDNWKRRVESGEVIPAYEAARRARKAKEAKLNAEKRKAIDAGLQQSVQKGDISSSDASYMGNYNKAKHS